MPALPCVPAETAGDGRVAALLSCDLCGARFPSGTLECGRCPFSGGCGIVRCPHCGYSFPRGSRTIDALRRLAGLWKGKKDGTAATPTETGESLADFPTGRQGRIVRVVSTDPRRRMRLANLGIVAGSLIRVEQHRPAAVVRVAETFLALDPSIAAEIYVSRS